MAEPTNPTPRTPRRPPPDSSPGEEARLPMGMSRTNRMLLLAATLLVLVLVLRTCA